MEAAFEVVEALVVVAETVVFTVVVAVLALDVVTF